MSFDLPGVEPNSDIEKLFKIVERTAVSAMAADPNPAVNRDCANTTSRSPLLLL